LESFIERFIVHKTIHYYIAGVMRPKENL